MFDGTLNHLVVIYAWDANCCVSVLLWTSNVLAAVTWSKLLDVSLYIHKKMNKGQFINPLANGDIHLCVKFSRWFTACPTNYILTSKNWDQVSAPQFRRDLYFVGLQNMQNRENPEIMTA